MTTAQNSHHPDANDVLMGGGGVPTLKLDQLRVWVGGTIVSKPIARQESEFGTGKPKVFPSGDPIMGILVDVQTPHRDAAIEDDNGVRRLYVEGKRLKEAVRAGVVASGAEGLQTNGQLFVAWTGEEVSGAATPAKTYEARYIPAAVAIPTNGASGAMPDPPAMGAPVTQAPAQAPMSPPPVSSPAPAAPMAEPPVQSPAAEDYVRATANALGTNDPTPEAIAALKAAGLDPTTVFPNYTG